MATLQHEFKYEGDAAIVPFNQIGLNLEIPTFEYITTTNSDHQVLNPERSLLVRRSLKFFQALNSENYTIGIPNQYLIGNSDESVLNFWKYLKTAKDLDSLSFQADLSIKHKSQILKNESFEIIYSLAASSDEFKQIKQAEEQLVSDTVEQAIIKYLKANVILINKKVFARIFDGFKNITGQNHSEPTLLTIISHITGDKLNEPVINKNEFSQFVKKLNITVPGGVNKLIDLLTDNFKELFNFLISVPEIEVALIAGDIRFLSQTNEKAQMIDLINYDLFAEYTEQATNVTKSEKYRWEQFTNEFIVDNTEKFDFRKNNEFVLIANQTTSVTVTLRLFDNTLLESKTFDILDKEDLRNIHFEVDLFKISQPDNTDTKELDNSNQQLKGKVLELSGKCSLKDLTVIIQAKVKAIDPLATDPLPRLVGSATTDSSGNFMMKYPFGVFKEAQAIVSLTPDSPVDIPVFTDPIHIEANQTISNDFLFLLLKDANCEPKDENTDGDCGCESKERISRLPDQEDLINSDKFSQDLGGGTCVNLTTPNRTLSETVHYAIVRTSEPDVANYILEKEVVSDNKNPTDFSRNKTTFRLSAGQKIERQPVDFGNPIHWQDDPDDQSNLTIYQAVQVAHGHLLTYKTAWKADGYSLGDLLYSLPLAPGQKKQIVINELKRTLEGSQQQILSQREGLSASIVNDRSIIDNLSGSVRESLRGRSSASTGGVSGGGGLGFLGPISGVLGVSGGYSKSSSSASQDSARNTTQSFNEVLHNSITQSANSFRKLNGTIIETVSESQEFATTSEVIANHNHCHALTMLYFEVLRHYAVYQELAQVEECIFVPLLMTNFTTENIYKWRDVLAENLLPRPSNTYLPAYFGRNPLVKAFDAINRLETQYRFVDFPPGAYNEEVITNITGRLDLRVNISRPKTRYDRIFSLPLVETSLTLQAFSGMALKLIWKEIPNPEEKDKNIHVDANFRDVPPAESIRIVKFDADFFGDDAISQEAWNTYAKLLNIVDGANNPLGFKLLETYFKGRLISEWDRIFYDEIAPKIVSKIGELLQAGFAPLVFDLTQSNKYTSGEQIITFNISGSTDKTRKQLDNTDWSLPAVAIPSSHTVLIAQRFRLNYSTNHFNGSLLNMTFLSDDLIDGVNGKFPPSSLEERRIPRKEDIFIVNELITHLNSNLEFYNRELWLSFDKEHQYLLLDGFNIEVFNDLVGGIVSKSLASVVKNELIGIAGNSLIFPVAAGVKLDRRNIIIHPVNIDGDNSTLTQSELDLFEHYKPLTPPPPYRISVPTRGVYAEAVQGACDACEKVEADTSQDWDKFKTDEPTAITPVTTGVPIATAFNPQFKDFATPIVNIQNAPAAPAPGVGLAGLSELLGKSDIFKDVTGLTENQKNAMATFLSNQENAKAFASMAKDMAIQGHNTEHSDKILDGIRNSPELSKEDKAKLIKEHLQKQIGEKENSTNSQFEDGVKMVDSLEKSGALTPEQANEVKATLSKKFADGEVSGAKELMEKAHETKVDAKTTTVNPNGTTTTTEIKNAETSISGSTELFPVNAAGLATHEGYAGKLKFKITLNDRDFKVEFVNDSFDFLDYGPIHAKTERNLTLNGSSPVFGTLIAINPRSTTLLYEGTWNDGTDLNDFLPLGGDAGGNITLGVKITLTKSDLKYSLPVAKNINTPCVEGQNEGSHAEVDSKGNKPSAFAVDLGMPRGTKIFAAMGGTVVDIIRRFPDIPVKPLPVDPVAKKVAQAQINLIRIRHDDLSYGEYAHLRMNGINVSLGQVIKQGDLIGFSGNSGYTSGDHLHFEVKKATLDGFQTVEWDFYDSQSNKFIPESNKIYEKDKGLVGGKVLHSPDDPENTVAGDIGDIFLKVKHGDPEISFYAKETGAPGTKTGWVRKTVFQ